MLHPPAAALGGGDARHPALRTSDAVCPVTWSLLTGRMWGGSDSESGSDRAL